MVEVEVNGDDPLANDFTDEMQQALNSRTAMIYILSDSPEPLSLESIAKLAKPMNIPILVDAAAEDLTVPNIHLQNGATMVASLSTINFGV